jgi:hypothetical protein
MLQCSISSSTYLFFRNWHLQNARGSREVSNVCLFICACVVNESISTGQWIDGQFILHVNNYDLEEGERSVWDQELGDNGGVRKEAVLTPKPQPLPRLKVPCPQRPQSLPSADELGRIKGNKVIQASKVASEGPMRHFFWKHRNKFLPFGATVVEPGPKDLPGEVGL